MSISFIQGIGTWCSKEKDLQTFKNKKAIEPICFFHIKTFMKHPYIENINLGLFWGHRYGQTPWNVP